MKCHGGEHFKDTNWCWGFYARRSFWSNKFENNSQVSYTRLFAFHVPTLQAPDNLSLLLQFPPLHRVLEQLPQIISLRLNITKEKREEKDKSSKCVCNSIWHLSYFPPVLEMRGAEQGDNDDERSESSEMKMKITIWLLIFLPSQFFSLFRSLSHDWLCAACFII